MERFGGRLMPDEIIFTGQSGTSYRYWISQPLGRPGGFGSVYSGERRDGMPVAVKIVDKQDRRGMLDHRLLRSEIEIGRRVAKSRSDMLLPVIDAAETSDALLLVMLRAERTMGDVPFPMSEPDVVTAITDIATGLRDLHAIGVIHRDLKPTNILRHKGRWKLADFGIARDQDIGTQDPTFLGAGSHPYMAPEIWGLRSPTVKTDLYALGCVAFELVASHPPYPGDRDVARESHRNRPLPDVPTNNGTLKNLITRLMAKNPGDRPQDARAVLDRLSRVALPRNTAQEALAHSIACYAQDRGRADAQRSTRADAVEALSQNAAQGRAELGEIFSDALDELQAVEPSASLSVSQDANDDVGERLSVICDLSTTDASLRVYLKNGGFWRIPESYDIIAFGCIFITNRYFDENRREVGSTWQVTGVREPQGNLTRRADLDWGSWSGSDRLTGLNAANLVYESVGTRFGWQIYRFRWPDNDVNYDAQGPKWHTHGLDHDNFPWKECKKVRSKSLARRLMSRRNAPYEFPSIGEKYSQSMSVMPLTVATALGLFREALDLRLPKS